MVTLPALIEPGLPAHVQPVSVSVIVPSAAATAVATGVAGPGALVACTGNGVAGALVGPAPWHPASAMVPRVMARIVRGGRRELGVASMSRYLQGVAARPERDAPMLRSVRRRGKGRRGHREVVRSGRPRSTLHVAPHSGAGTAPGS